MRTALMGIGGWRLNPSYEAGSAANNRVDFRMNPFLSPGQRISSRHFGLLSSFLYWPLTYVRRVFFARQRAKSARRFTVLPRET
jgi:hypothetical protein